MTGWKLAAGNRRGGHVERDRASEKGGEQAAWRDLVARLESPVRYDAACPPWPERENLPVAADAPQHHGNHGNHGTHDDAGALELDDAEDDDDFVPPPVGLLPGADAVTRGAWVALFGGPAYLFVAALLGWQLSGWSELAAILAFVAGFLVLVFRLGDGPSRRDGPDQGAVV